MKLRFSPDRYLLPAAIFTFPKSSHLAAKNAFLNLDIDSQINTGSDMELSVLQRGLQSADA